MNAVKANEYVDRAVFTGITKISRETLFSDMNHLIECIMMDNLYADVFGFTEKEMADIEKEYNIEHR